MLGLGICQVIFTIFWWKLSPKYSRDAYPVPAPREMKPLTADPTPAGGVQGNTIQSEPLLRRPVGQVHTPGGRPTGGQDGQPFSPAQITKFIDADKSKESLA